MAAISRPPWILRKKYFCSFSFHMGSNPLKIISNCWNHFWTVLHGFLRDSLLNRKCHWNGIKTIYGSDLKCMIPPDISVRIEDSYKFSHTKKRNNEFDSMWANYCYDVTSKMFYLESNCILSVSTLTAQIELL